MAINFKPRPRSRRPRFGGGGSPSKRTRGGSLSRLRKNKEEKPDYSNRLPRPTKSQPTKSMQSEVKPVVATTPKVDPIMPTRPAPVEPPQMSTETRAQPGRMPQEELRRKPPVNLDQPLQDPFTSGQSSIDIPDVSMEPPAFDFDSEVTREFIPGGGMPIQVPKQQQQVGVLPGVTSGSSILPMVTPENQPNTLPAPAGQAIPVVPQPFVDPFNLPKEDPSKVRAFGIKKSDGSFFSPEETRDLLSEFTLEELKAMFGEAAITNVLTDR